MNTNLIRNSIKIHLRTMRNFKRTNAEVTALYCYINRTNKLLMLEQNN